jgi:hypothetical protein
MQEISLQGSHTNHLWRCSYKQSQQEIITCCIIYENSLSILKFFEPVQLSCRNLLLPWNHLKSFSTPFASPLVCFLAKIRLLEKIHMWLIAGKICQKMNFFGTHPHHHPRTKSDPLVKVRTPNTHINESWRVGQGVLSTEKELMANYTSTQQDGFSFS